MLALKSSLRLSKLRFFGLRRPKISSCYIITIVVSCEKKAANSKGWRPIFLFPFQMLLQRLAQMARVEVGVYLGGEYALVAE